MAANSGRINFKVKAFVNRPGVIKKIGKWKLGQLSRVGAYGRGAMKKQIRPRPVGKKANSVLLTPTAAELPPNWKGPIVPIQCYVPPNGGKVLNAKTQRPVTRALAQRAWIETKLRDKGKGEGKPPRRGPTDKLRKHIYFAIDTANESVVIGPEPFPKQPQLVGRVSVPELLNKGGVEIIMGDRVKYGPRPYVEPMLKVTLNKLRQNIAAKPVSNRI
jgi:hypothetical protein